VDFHFAGVLVFLGLAVVFCIFLLVLSRMLRPSAPSSEKQVVYECGERPTGSPWIKFNIRFYVVALIFVIFDVEVVFLYPWAVVFRELGGFAFAEMLVFLGILFLGLAYVWKKGDLEWVRPEPRIIWDPAKPSPEEFRPASVRATPVAPALARAPSATPGARVS
jgi:NADH-quinone oxidoreductase subunit A